MVANLPPSNRNAPGLLLAIAGTAAGAVAQRTSMLHLLLLVRYPPSPINFRLFFCYIATASATTAAIRGAKLANRNPDGLLAICACTNSPKNNLAACSVPPSNLVFREEADDCLAA